MKNEAIPAVVIPSEIGIWFGILSKLGQIAAIMTCVTFPPLTVCIANQKTARITLEMIATPLISC